MALLSAERYALESQKRDEAGEGMRTRFRLYSPYRILRKKSFLLRQNTVCLGGNDCCTEEVPCSLGEGDCDTDDDCIGELVCNHVRSRFLQKHQ